MKAISADFSVSHWSFLIPKVVPGRLELPTSTLSVWRSNQLSYRTLSGWLAVQDLGHDYRCPASFFSLSKKQIISTRRKETAQKTKTGQTDPVSKLQRRIDQKHQRQKINVSRKEVFQPHLPVRLPCYDLAPITGFALGRSSRSRTSGTPGFHGLTGGVYKARERIHRAMADARLLANPAS